jgi:SAGA-associated factor 29
VFYSSTVKSAPAPGTGHGLGLRGGAPKKKDPEALPGKYRLLFVEEEVIRTVHKDMVVPVSYTAMISLHGRK